MCDEVPQPLHCYVLPKKPQTVVQTFYFPNLTYLNIQIIAHVKAHHNPGIVICRQRKPQRAAVEYLEEPTSTLSLLCIAKTDPSEAK